MTYSRITKNPYVRLGDFTGEFMISGSVLVRVTRGHLPPELTKQQFAEVITMSRTVGGHLPQLTVGPTALRPQISRLWPGDQYFDTTIDRVIFVNGAESGWIDATGKPVADGQRIGVKRVAA